MGINPDELKNVLAGIQEGEDFDKSAPKKRNIFYFIGFLLGATLIAYIMFLGYDYVNNAWGLPELSAPKFLVSYVFVAAVIRTAVYYAKL